MAVLNSVMMFLGLSEAVAPSIAAPGGMWHSLILKSFAFVADYGWRIVVFTVLLKLVISPLDFYQRYKMNKNQKITERLKPTMEKIQKQYGNDKQAFQQKQMELNRKEGYSYFSACLPMIITMVVFITLWISMQTIARYMIFKEYATMYDEYTYVTEQLFTPPEGDAELNDEQVKQRKLSVLIGQNVVKHMYYNGLDEGYVQELEKYVEELKKQDAENKTASENDPQIKYEPTVPENFAFPQDFKLLRDGQSIEKVQASFLWIKNIWAPDVPWGSQAVLSEEAFKSGIGDYADAATSGLETPNHDRLISKYSEVMGGILSDTTQSRTNGYLILPILVVLLSAGAQLLSMFQQKRAGQVNAKGGMATSMKVMMFLMPVMMAVFAIQSASIFSLYMATNSATTLFFNFLFTGIIRLIDRIKANRKYGIKTGGAHAAASSDIIHYVKGANPNAGAREVATNPASGKKSGRKNSSASAPVRGGRPDPNDLMNYDMSASNKNKKK